MTRAEVEAALGKPIAALKRGERTVLTYPKGGRVTLEGDRVVEMDSVEVAAREVKVPSPLPEAPAPPVDTAVSAKPPTPPLTIPAPMEELAPGEMATPELPVSLRNLGAPAKPEKPSAFWLMLIIAAVIRVPVVMVMLKLAFRWADVHADWGQMFLPALVDTLVRSTFAVVGHVLWNINSWFYVDEAFAYLALLIVLMKATHACTFARAVAVGGVAKVMSVVISAAISVLVFRLLR